MTIPDRKIVQEKIFWRGILTQSMCLDLGGELLNALNESDTLAVNFDHVELIDFSCLVLLCSVKRQANEKGKNLVLDGVESPAVATVIQRFRSNGNRLCRAYCGNSCLFE